MKYLKLFENFDDNEDEEEEDFYDMITVYKGKYTIINFKYLFQFFNNFGIIITKENITIGFNRIVITHNRLAFSNGDITNICKNLKNYDEVVDCGLSDDRHFTIHFKHDIKMFDHWWEL